MSARRRWRRAFLDANVLFSAAWRADSGLVRLREVPETRLITSHYAVEEARRNLPEESRPRLGEWLELVETVGDVVTGVMSEGMGLPSKDRPILLSALAANATHLLTGDRAHFGPWFDRTVQGLWIGSPATFLSLSDR